MKLPVLTIVIAFVAWLTVKLSESKKATNDVMHEYWKKEEESNAVRRKSLDELDYIEFPFDVLPSEESFFDNGSTVPASLQMLKDLEDKKIVNLNNISNTDLKLTYGTANINILTEYDENFLVLCREGFLLSEYLNDTGRTEDACALSQALINCGSDVCGQYTLLKKIYLTSGDEEKAAALTQIAENLESGRKNAILKALEEVENELSAEASASGEGEGSYSVISDESDASDPMLDGIVEDIPSQL